MATTGRESLLDGLTPKQRAVVTHETGPLLVIAGPGAGKTEVMLRRAAYLILDRGIEPEAILLTTFTRKAAEELRVRLARFLGGRIERVLITTIMASASGCSSSSPNGTPTVSHRGSSTSTCSISSSSLMPRSWA